MFITKINFSIILMINYFSLKTFIISNFKEKFDHFTMKVTTTFRDSAGLLHKNPTQRQILMQSSCGNKALGWKYSV